MTSTSQNAGWFATVRRLLDITQITPGLPIPQIGRYRVSYYYTDIVHAGDAAEAVGDAQTVLSYALGVTFTPKRTEIGSARHYILEAHLLSADMVLSIVALAEHFPGQDEPALVTAPEFAAVA